MKIKWKTTLTCNLTMVVLLMLSSSCSPGKVFGSTHTPTLTPSPTPTLTPTATLTPTPLPDLPFGETHTGSIWEITILDIIYIDTIKMVGGVSAHPIVPDSWMVVILQLKNKTAEEQPKIFTQGSTDAVSTQQAVIPYAGFVIPDSISGRTGTGFIAEAYTGVLKLGDKDGNGLLIVGGQDGYFSVDYTVKTGNTIQVGLLYALYAGQELLGVNLGQSYPLLLIK